MFSMLGNIVHYYTFSVPKTREYCSHLYIHLPYVVNVNAGQYCSQLYIQVPYVLNAVQYCLLLYVQVSYVLNPGQYCPQLYMLLYI